MIFMIQDPMDYQYIYIIYFTKLISSQLTPVFHFVFQQRYKDNCSLQQKLYIPIITIALHFADQVTKT